MTKPRLLDTFCKAGIDLGIAMKTLMCYNYKCLDRRTRGVLLFNAATKHNTIVGKAPLISGFTSRRLSKQLRHSDKGRFVMTATIGEIRIGHEVGFNSPKKVMWCACFDCGKERWVFLKNGKPQSERCHPCGAIKSADKRKALCGPKHWHWGGGRHVNKNGYITIWLDPDSPYAAMRDKDGQVYEHRIVMAQYLGRPLESWEEVHHKNHDKHHNVIENLELTDRKTHAFNHTNVKSLIARISELERVLSLYRNKYGDIEA